MIFWLIAFSKKSFKMCLDNFSEGKGQKAKSYQKLQIMAFKTTSFSSWQKIVLKELLELPNIFLDF